MPDIKNAHLKNFVVAVRQKFKKKKKKIGRWKAQNLKIIEQLKSLEVFSYLKTHRKE